MADDICVDWGLIEELTHLGGSAKVRANYQDYSSQESAQHCLIGLHPFSNPLQTWSQMLACNSQNLCSSALPVALWVMGPHLLMQHLERSGFIFSTSVSLTSHCTQLSALSVFTANFWAARTSVTWDTKVAEPCQEDEGSDSNVMLGQERRIQPLSSRMTWPELQMHQGFLKSPNSSLLPSFHSWHPRKESFLSPQPLHIPIEFRE